MFKGRYFWSPQKSNTFTYKMLPPHPTPFLMPFLESSGNFFSENVYFCRGRVNIYDHLNPERYAIWGFRWRNKKRVKFKTHGHIWQISTHYLHKFHECMTQRL